MTLGDTLKQSDLRHLVRGPEECMVMARFWDLQEAGQTVTADAIASGLAVASLQAGRIKEILDCFVADGFVIEACGTYSTPWRRGQWLAAQKIVQRCKWPVPALVEKTAENLAASLLTGEGFFVQKPYYDLRGGDLYILHREVNSTFRGVVAHVQVKGRTGSDKIHVDIPPEYWNYPLFFLFVYWLNLDQYFILDRADWAGLCRNGAAQRTLTIKREQVRSLKLRKLGDLKSRTQVIQHAMNDVAAQSPFSWIWDAMESDTTN